MPKTDNYELPKPDKGTTDWHIPLNKRADIIDAAIAEAAAANAETGPWETRLVGSDDPSSPRSGLADRISDAINNGRPCIDVRGAWTMDGEVSFSSGQFNSPQNVPVHIDARAAYVEYDGSGWAFTNDNTNDAGCALRGENFSLHGGYWLATDNPDGFARLIDTGGCRLYPNQTREWNNGSGDCVIYQIEQGEQWCESNHLGGRHHLPDIGIKSVASRGTSFQDHDVDAIHLSEFKTTAFDLSGNWIDCHINNPTAIAAEEDAVFLRQNGNMGGTLITAPELEDSGSNLSNFYFCEVGPRATRGPVVNGGQMDLNFNPITFFDTSDASGGWNFVMHRMDDEAGNHYVTEYYSSNGATRTILNATNLRRQNASFVRGDWTPEWHTEASL